jgi:hypothetical protein
MTDIPPTTSASQLTAYTMCPRLYAMRYVYHVEPEFRSLNLALGSAVHGAIGWFFEEKLAGRIPSLEDADRIVAADLLAETSGLVVRWKDETPDSLEQKAQALVRTYLGKFSEQDVVAIEQRFEVGIEHPETGESLPRPLVGYFDLLVRTKNQNIIEIKTTSKAWHPKSLERHLQVGSYVTAANAMHGGPAHVSIHAILKQKAPRIEEYHVERGEYDKLNLWFFQAAKEIEAAITAGHFPPSPGNCCYECEYGKACIEYHENVVPLRWQHRAPQRNDRQPLRIAV